MKNPPPPSTGVSPETDEIKWEMQQMGVVDDGPMIKISVTHGSSHHDLYLPAQSTLWDVKKLLSHKTGLRSDEQRLFFKGKEKDDEDHLHMEGVKNNSKLLLLEDASSKERKLEEIRKHNKMLKAFEAVAGVRAEVDKLSDWVSALEVAVDGGTRISDKEFIVCTELLMRQLLKLDGIEAEGESKLQRKAEVRRVQNFVDTLDSLKARNSNPFNKSDKAVSVTTQWETFNNGIRSLNTPTSTSSSSKM
ncbi:putative BAG domain-containing protein [Lupinus albus]|uniref:Putative BAG domain-containing protein n=1 Tax=Lupinus albus TaxID=3870 RepID=A0A6A4RBJ2_LUPAL|nr:putative BAG domain-containing protein [Lupinus albus]